MNMVKDLARFHQKFEMPENSTPALLDKELMNFRVKFLQEELDETIDAFEDGNIFDVADGLIDLVYVAIGTAELMGLPWKELWNEVQKANMAKERAIKEEDSKRGSTFDVIKPEGWTPPDIATVLAKAGRKEYDRKTFIKRG